MKTNPFKVFRRVFDTAQLKKIGILISCVKWTPERPVPISKDFLMLL